jgi:hypothetical protein
MATRESDDNAGAVFNGTVGFEWPAELAPGTWGLGALSGPASAISARSQRNSTGAATARRTHTGERTDGVKRSVADHPRVKSRPAVPWGASMINRMT